MNIKFKAKILASCLVVSGLIGGMGIVLPVHAVMQVSDANPADSEKCDIEVINNKLVTAVTEGNEKRVKKLLEKGADANYFDDSGSPLLINAVRQDRINIVRLLLDYGADPNSRNFFHGSQTALHYAVINGNLDMVFLLVDQYGIDLNLKDVNGETALHKALSNYSVLMNNPDTRRMIVEYLIGNGAMKSINEQDYLHRTVLSRAVRFCDKDIVDLVINSGGDKDINFRYRPANDLLRVLIGHTESMDSPLAIAIKDCQSVDKVKLLLKYGADVDMSHIKYARRHGLTQIEQVLKQHYKKTHWFGSIRCLF